MFLKLKLSITFFRAVSDAVWKQRESRKDFNLKICAAKIGLTFSLEKITCKLLFVVVSPHKGVDCIFLQWIKFKRWSQSYAILLI